MPSRFREPLSVSAEGKLVVTIDMREQCLLLYPLPEWEVVQRKLESLSNIGDKARRLLREFAGLEKKLVLVGQGNKVEIWSSDLWQERMSSWLKEDTDLLSDSDEFTGLSV